ncbi:MAG: sterol desaturase family protein [Sphingomonadaceae bacterium]
MITPLTLYEVARNDIIYYLPYEFGRYFIGAGLLSAIVWGLKRTPWRRRQIQPRSATRADLQREISSSIISCLVYLAVAIPIDWAVHNGILTYGGDNHSLGYNLMMFAAIILGHDAYFYWTHRAMHAKWLFKTFHRHHHRSVTSTPRTAYSFSIPEAALNALFMAVWLTFVPTPGIVTFAFLFFQIIRNVTAHAGLELHPRWWLSTPITSWINTTTHHDLHHGGAFTYNYGTWFTFWDKLMGTEHPDYRATFDRVVGNAAVASGGLYPTRNSPA